ncbi:MAG: sulfur oxidation c-type cytochrome SoxA [Hyphomicrobiaceae bacterium]
MLWVEKGRSLWTKSDGATGKSCASCHGDLQTVMKGVAARYPLVDQKSKTLMNIEGRINNCRTDHQQAPPLPYESNELLSLTSAITYQSRGDVRLVGIDGAAEPFFTQGRALFEQRQGQLNLACVQCHDGQVGRKLRGDTVSQGQTHGWPAYRLEWQSMGSLHRRIRSCSIGVRAEVLPYGAPSYLALELYLAWRGGSLPMESPGVRR